MINRRGRIIDIRCHGLCMADNPLDMDLEDAGLEKLSGLSDFYKRNAKAETKAAKMKGGVGTNKLDESAREFSQKRIQIDNEIFGRLADVHESRSEYAQKQDEARQAEIADSPMQWKNDPNSYDWPGLDTKRE